MKEKNSGIDITNQLYINTLMFKENLKLITTNLIDLIWKDKIKNEKNTKNLEKTIFDLKTSGIEIIKEEEENFEEWESPPKSSLYLDKYFYKE